MRIQLISGMRVILKHSPKDGLWKIVEVADKGEGNQFARLEDDGSNQYSTFYGNVWVHESNLLIDVGASTNGH